MLKYFSLLATVLGVVTVYASAAGADSRVTITQDENTYALSNGIVSAKVSKRNGDLVSMIYKGIETMYVPGPGGGGGGGHPWGYWEQTPGPESRLVDAITIDPSANNGQRGEVSVKGYYTGQDLGTGAPGGGATCDIELRYAIGAGESGVYTTAIFTHQPNYPTGGIGESRWGAKLNPDVFDWMTVDSRRDKLMLTPQDWAGGTELNHTKEVRLLNTGIYKGQVEHKYDYSADLFDTPAFGWSSTAQHIGFWCINPTIEYIGGGATKVELTCHRDLNDVAPPTLLDYWRGTHYGGTVCPFAKGESWTKVVGPIFNYCNSGATPDLMYQDALSQASKEAGMWPYDWVAGVDYPTKSQRSAVSGQLALNDPLMSGATMSNVLVGLAHPEYAPPAGRGRGNGDSPRVVDWQQDAKYYQFWTKADDQGRFLIPNVRPGTYTLHAIADGVLGEFAKTDVTVASGQSLDLGHLSWQPVRYGRQLWDIGIANRSASEFLHGDHYWQWGLYMKYPTDFPHDVDYTIGKSDFHKDWNYAQVPRTDGKSFTGKPTTWSIHYTLPTAPAGKATLRLAICGSSHLTISVTVNDKPAGNTGPLIYTATINRDGITGYWFEKDVAFDASLMQAGQNVLKLSIPGGAVTTGIEYDYVRLELGQ